MKEKRDTEKQSNRRKVKIMTDEDNKVEGNEELDVED